MAHLNLLKAGYSGKLGQTNGIISRQTAIIRSSPFGKKKPNDNQKNAFRAFNALNRICCHLSKEYKEYVHLNTSSMYLHNALVKHLKKSIEGGTFNPAEIPLAFPYPDSLEISNIEYMPDSRALFLSVTPLGSAPEVAGATINAILSGEGGYIFGTGKSLPSSPEIVMPVEWHPLSPMFILAFIAQNGPPLHGLGMFSLALLEPLP